MGSQEAGYKLLDFANTSASRLPRALVRPLQEAVTGALEKFQFNPNLPRKATGINTPTLEPVAAAPEANTIATSAPGDLDLTARLQRLKSLRDADLISEDEFQAQRQRILAEL